MGGKEGARRWLRRASILAASAITMLQGDANIWGKTALGEVGGKKGGGGRGWVDLRHLEERKDIYLPQEDTWLLADTISRDIINRKKGRSQVCGEVGCGSGAVIATVARALLNRTKDWRFWCSDLNPAAVTAAKDTFKVNRIPCKAYVADLFPPKVDPADIIIFNPPYLPSEDRSVGSLGLEGAWAGGKDGVQVINRFVEQVSQVSNFNATVYLLLETRNRPKQVASRMASHGFSGRHIATRKTSDGFECLQVWKFTKSQPSSRHTDWDRLRGGVYWGLTRDEGDEDDDIKHSNSNQSGGKQFLRFLSSFTFTALNGTLGAFENNYEIVHKLRDPDEDTVGSGAGLLDEMMPVQPNPMETYVRTYSLALRAEWEHAQSEYNARIRDWSFEELVDNGYCIPNLRIRITWGGYGQRLYRMYKQDGTPFEKGEHRLNKGDNVILSSMRWGNPRNRKRSHDCYVVSRGARAITIALHKWKGDDEIPFPEDLVWRLDATASPVMYERMQEAIETFGVSYRHPWISEHVKLIPVQPVLQRNLRRMATSEDILISAPPLSQPPRYLVDGPRLPIHEYDESTISFLSNTEFFTIERIRNELDGIELNSIQYRAIEKALYLPVTMIQGPPGTGKTSTAAELIGGWLRLHQAAPGDTHVPLNRRRVLAVAQSNIAVDQILEALIRRGIKAIRVGDKTKIRPTMIHASLEHVAETHPKMEEIRQKQKMLSEYSAEVSLLDPSTEEHIYHSRNISRMHDELSKSAADLRAMILMTYDVVCTTCMASGQEQLSDDLFGLVLVDEAAQATEPEALVPLIKSMHRIVFIGDHHQLPPTVLSSDPRARTLKVSLFERGILSGLISSTMLRVQYRMHPDIADWPNKRFYNGLLMNGIERKDRVYPTPHWWPHNVWNETRTPVAFIEVEQGKDEQNAEGSRINRPEARVIIETVKRLLGIRTKSKGIQPNEVGIISPYAAQIDLLKQMRDDDTELQEVQERFNFTVEVRTVDGYQGREKDFIIMTTVVANDVGRVGFLNDWRRVNVALTRARLGLIVVGNQDTLSFDPHWENWLRWIDNRNLQVDASEIFGEEFISGKIADPDQADTTGEFESDEPGIA